MDEFENWLNNGPDWPFPGRQLVLLSEVEPFGRCLVSRTSISPGSCCLAIPTSDLRLVLTPLRCTTMLNLCGCFQHLKKRIVLNPFDLLVLFIYHITCPLLPTCPLPLIWRTYLRILPSFYTDPSFVHTTQLKYIHSFSLRSQDIQFSEQKSIERIRSTWTALGPLLYDPNTSLSTPTDKFAWAWSTVNSRCVYCRLNESCASASPLISSLAKFLNVSPEQFSDLIQLRTHKDPNIALIPFFDFFNHNPGVESKLEVDPKGKAIRLFVQQAYATGEQVFINYGPHDNLTLFIEYGFSLSPEDNPNNAVYPSCIDLREFFMSEYRPVSASHRSIPTEEWQSRLTFILQHVLEQLGLHQSGSSTNTVTWSTVCFSKEGASYHLSLLLYCVNRALSSEDHESELDLSSPYNSVFSLPEHEILPMVQTPLTHLAAQLLQDTVVDEQKLLSLLSKVPSTESLVIYRYFEELKKVLLSRRTILENFLS